MNKKPEYARHQADVASEGFKYRSRYEMEGAELHNLNAQKPAKYYTQVLDLSVAAPPTNPRLIQVAGRSVAIFGITTATLHDPDANTGIETVAPSAFVWAYFDDDINDNGIPLKHSRGFRGDFWRLRLTWPAQAGVSARLIVFKFDEQPWQSGEAAT